MTRSAALLFGERGFSGTGLRDVIAHSSTPRGSIYHHFAGGKAELAREAVRHAAGTVAGPLGDAARDGDPIATLHAWVDYWRDALARSDFRAGSAVLAVAAEPEEQTGAARRGGGGVRRLGRRLRRHAARRRRPAQEGGAARDAHGVGDRGRGGRVARARRHGGARPGRARARSRDRGRALLGTGRRLALAVDAARDQRLRPLDQDLRPLLRPELRGVGRAGRPAPARARQARGLGVRDGRGRAGRRPDRRARLLAGAEPRVLQPRQRPRRQRAGLVRGPAGRRRGRAAVGPVARLPDAGAARHGRARARAGLRHRADRVPGLGRRRLRQGLGRAVGDGLSRRHRADRAGRDGAPDADLRDARHGARWPTCSGSCATACAPACCSRSTS